jgi:hypothetical protein
MRLKDNDKVLLIIYYTYNEKEGTQTYGVGNFYDHSKETHIWGNSFVISVVQSNGLFIPHKAKIYVKKDHKNDNFRTKIDIAFEEIIKPLVVPKNIDLYIVFDSWWYLCSPECLDFIYSGPKFIFPFQHLIRSPFDSRTFLTCTLLAAWPRMQYLAFVDTTSYQVIHGT